MKHIPYLEELVKTIKSALIQTYFSPLPNNQQAGVSEIPTNKDKQVAVSNASFSKDEGIMFNKLPVIARVVKISNLRKPLLL